MITTKAEICATPPQNRKRFFIPKHLRSPFGIYKNRASNGSSAGSEQNYTFSGKSKLFNLFHHHNTSSSISREEFLHKNFTGISSMNSSTNSESALLANTSPTQSITKVKHRDNKENKLQRFSGAVANALNGGTLVFGKIKSLWSHSNTVGLNILADSDRLQPSKSKENLGLDSHFSFCFRVFDVISFPFACDDDFTVFLFDLIVIGFPLKVTV